ncbi:MAG: restriction endonuclease subunit S [Malacoplasma sp.]|nr:restriction endonuclease subunit S [Malacoplasma sp.]
MQLKELFSFLPKSKRPASYGKSEGKYPFFNSSNVVNKFMDVPDYNGEFLIIGDGGSGNCKYYNGSFSSSDHTYVLQPKENVNCKLIKYFLEKDSYKILNEGFKGVGIKNISKSYIENIEFKKNKKYSDAIILNSLDSINSLINNLNDQIILFDELIKSRFNGQEANIWKEN